MPGTGEKSARMAPSKPPSILKIVDMEAKVNHVLKMIDDNGDSFAKRAEMYYRKKPEIIEFIEEAFRSYRALVERYEYLSREQNRAVGSLSDVEEENASVKHSKNMSWLRKLTQYETEISSKAEALEKIKELENKILEFDAERKTYEDGYNKYCEYEDAMIEIQRRVSDLGNKFAIYDHQGNSLIAGEAIESCKDTLAELEEKQKTLAQHAEAGKQKIKKADEKLKNLKDDLSCTTSNESENSESPPRENMKVNNNLESDKGSTSDDTMKKLMAKIDQLAGKVSSLGSVVISQTELVDKLTKEADELNDHIEVVEDDKDSLIRSSSEMKNTINELDNELKGVKRLNRQVEKQNANLKTDLSDANNQAHDLSLHLENANAGKHVDIDHEESEYEEDRHGLEEKKKIPVEEYKMILQKLTEVEENNRRGLFELAMQNRELKNAVSYKDVEIEFLRNKLYPNEKRYSISEGHQSEGSRYSFQSTPQLHHNAKTPSRYERETKGNAIEEKIRKEIDEYLEESLEFWLRFSASISQVQKFHKNIERIDKELLDAYNSSTEQKLDFDKIQTRADDIQDEMKQWLQNNKGVKDELQAKYSMLCHIQDEITRAVRFVVPEGADSEDTKLGKYQAATFYGEVTKMKHEIGKASSEFQTGVQRINEFKSEVEKILEKVEEIPRILSMKAKGPRIPLKSFLFGVKLKKQSQSQRQKQQKQSMFSRTAGSSPSLQRQYSYITRP